MRTPKVLPCALVLAATACASSVPVANAPPEPVRASSASALPTWSATLNAVQERNSEVRQTTPNRARGNFTMTPGEPGWSNVELSFSANAPGAGSGSAGWAILPSGCGSDVAPLLPLSSFPILELGGSGAAQVSARIHLDFPRTGNYHVNVYRAESVMNSDTRSVSGVLACGNLKYKP